MIFTRTLIIVYILSCFWDFTDLVVLILQQKAILWRISMKKKLVMVLDKDKNKHR